LHFHAALSHGEDQGFEFCIKGFSLVVIAAGRKETNPWTWWYIKHARAVKPLC